MNTTQIDAEQRRRSARVLSQADHAELAELWRAWPDPPAVEHARSPEAGLVMVQGRIGGRGARFNLGEASVTRATVVIRDAEGESTGTAYVLGNRPEHAELAAIFDAMLSSPRREDVLRAVITPLENRQAEADEVRGAQSRSTVVEFFTAARENSGSDEGEDE